ncbi:glycosidase, partial [bacterium]
MSKIQILNEKSIPNLPWQDRPAGSDAVAWRYDRNPVIPRDILPNSNSVFNSAVIPYQGEFAGVFRIDDHTRKMQLHRGFSKDGLNWNI